MSLEVLTQGGGTGGESASIFIIGLSESDTVSATKDGKTVVGKWVEKAVKVPYKIPTMISNTAPSGVASASSYYNYNDGTNPPYYAFDGAVGTTWRADVGKTASETYLQYAFGRPVSIQTLHIDLGTDYANAYKDVTFSWVLQGSVDGSTWENLTEARTHKVSVRDTLELAPLSNNYYAYLRFQILSSSTGISGSRSQYLFNVIELQVDAYYEEMVSGHIIPIKSCGLWTVTATNGEDTTTQDVLVDAAIEFAIPMSLSA